ncbi:MAG: hypothetical protein PSX81_05770 [bacterium]|nr:hypothetical protein [bacterium]
MKNPNKQFNNKLVNSPSVKPIVILIYIIIGLKNSLYSSSNNDTLVLLKIQYYKTHHLLSFTGRGSGEKSQSDFLKFKYDSIIDFNTLEFVDSILRLSNSYKLRLNDTITDDFDEKTTINRVIVFTYNSKKIYISDFGNWDYDRRFSTWIFQKKNPYIPPKREKRNKNIWINGRKVKNDTKLKSAIDIITNNLHSDTY